MVRKSKKQLEEEAASSAAAADSEADENVFDEVDSTTELVDPTPVKEPKEKAPLAARPTAAEIAAAEPKRYLVKRGGKIMHRGFMTLLRTGKVIRAGGYNIPQLEQQGIELEEVKE